MVFYSASFIVFFIIFFICYWFVFNGNLKFQNLLLLIGNYVFYSWVDWRFLLFLIFVSGLNFFLGINIEKTANPKYKRVLLYIGIFQGIASLAFFKYFNFFIASFNDFFHLVGLNISLQALNIIIPLGISFYTFKTISYLLDVDKGKIGAVKDWVVFFNYVSFFLTILAGPIDRARSFIPQLENKRVFVYDQAVDGLRQILWGVFKKIVIADRLAEVTNYIFDNYETLPASSLLSGAFLYTIQIYADFSGYSDMAIGFSRLIGFNVTKNFDYPLFAQNIAEFWRKWHISLTSWLTEYIYTPINISLRDYGKMGMILAILINFVLVGIWHGANWTYVLFGLIQGALFIPLILNGTINKKKKNARNKGFPTIKEFLNISGTFMLVMFSLILFKAVTIKEAWGYFFSIFSVSLFSMPPHFFKVIFLIVFSFLFLGIEWYGKDKDFSFASVGVKWKIGYRYALYCIMILAIFWSGGKGEQFIYAKF